MSVNLGKASRGRHFQGATGGGGPGIVTPGTGFINVELPDTQIGAMAQDTRVTATLQDAEITAETQDVQITATAVDQPISVTVFPESIVAGISGESAPPFTGQTVSVDFDGTEYLLALGPAFPDLQQLGFSNAWSQAVWWRPASGTSAVNGICGFGTTQFFTRQRGSLRWETDAVPSRVEIECGGTEGLSGKRFTYDDLATEDFWNFDLMTWDGTNFLLYHNGLFVAPTAMPQNDAVTMSDASSRRITVGTIAAGLDDAVTLIHSHGLWSVTLTAAEALALWNGGGGRNVDWGSDRQSYTSSAALAHWYRLGLDPSDIGKDYGNSPHSTTGLINIGDDAVGIDASDIVVASP